MRRLVLNLVTVNMVIREMICVCNFFSLCSFACLFVVVVGFYNYIASYSAAFSFLGEIAMRLYDFSHCIHDLSEKWKRKIHIGIRV